MENIAYRSTCVIPCSEPNQDERFKKIVYSGHEHHVLKNVCSSYVQSSEPIGLISIVAELWISSDDHDYLRRIRNILALSESKSSNVNQRANVYFLSLSEDALILSESNGKEVLNVYELGDIKNIFRYPITCETTCYDEAIIIKFRSKDGCSHVRILEPIDFKPDFMIFIIRKKMNNSYGVSEMFLPGSIAKASSSVEYGNVDVGVQVNVENISDIAEKLFNSNYLRIQIFVMRISQYKLNATKSQVEMKENNMRIVKKDKLQHSHPIFKYVTNYVNRKIKQSSSDSYLKTTTKGKASVPTRPEFKEALLGCKICFEVACYLSNRTIEVDIKARLLLVFNVFKRIVEVARSLEILNDIKDVSLPLFSRQTKSLLSEKLSSKNYNMMCELGKCWSVADGGGLCAYLFKMRLDPDTMRNAPTFFKRINDELDYSLNTGNNDALAYMRLLPSKCNESVNQSISYALNQSLCVATSTYEAESPAEISVNGGQTVTLLNKRTEDGGTLNSCDWHLIATDDGRTGFVPNQTLFRI